MAVTVPSAVFQELVLSVDKGIADRNKSIKIDRKAMPLLDFWMGRKKQVNGAQGVVRVNLQVSDSGDNEGWTNMDPLSFSENFPALGFEFGTFNLHRGLLFVYDYLMNEGYDVDFNSGSSKIATPLSKVESVRLRDILAEKIENFRDAWKVSLDKNLTLDGTQDTKLPPGLDAMLPLSLTGTYGGLPRSDVRIQHYVATGLTYSTGGTMRSAMNTAMWNAKLNSRGTKRSAYRIICGRGFADRYASYATNNSWQVHTMATGTPKLDINIADSGLEFDGMSLEINPTFAILDGLYAPTIPFDRRAYFLHEDSFVLGCPNKTEEKFSNPPDPANIRVARASLDHRLAPYCNNPNANAVVSVVA